MRMAFDSECMHYSECITPIALLLIIIDCSYGHRSINYGLCISLLSGLVSVTSGAGFFQPFDSLIIGGIGSLIFMQVPPIMDRYRIDDPVGAVAVHGACGAWGAFCVGLFAVNEPDILENGGLTRGQCGLFKVAVLKIDAVPIYSIHNSRAVVSIFYWCKCWQSFASPCGPGSQHGSS